MEDKYKGIINFYFDEEAPEELNFQKCDVYVSKLDGYPCFCFKKKSTLSIKIKHLLKKLFLSK